MSEPIPSSDRRFVRRTVLISALAMLLIIAGVYALACMRPRLASEAAQDAAFAGDYALMREKLDALAQLDEPLYYDTLLSCARLADYNGDQETALELLDVPAADGDDAYAAFAAAAQEQAQVSTYHQALHLYETGDYARAARLAATVRRYEPAQALYELAQAAYEASLPTPPPTATPAPTASDAPAQTAAPTPAPSAALWPEGRLAAGFEHTVVLLEDGTVRAFGDNSYGQLNVQDWQDVVFVAAGAYHTLGLTAGGRVLACGDNTHLQTDAALFSGVRAIAAGDYASFLLLHNGQVMSTGYLPYEFLNELTGAQAIWAGSYGLMVRTADGLRVSHPGYQLDAACERFALSRAYAVGVDAQGTTHATTALIPQWTGVSRLAASETVLIGLTQDGRVVSHLFDRHSRLDLCFDQPALAAAAGPNHAAFVLADGTLSIRHADGTQETHDLSR